MPSLDRLKGAPSVLPAAKPRAAARPAVPAGRGVPGDTLSLSAARAVSPAAPAAPFRYDGLAIEDLRAAQAWTPDTDGLSGLDANRELTVDYHNLDQAMTGYLGEPTLPNWMTFGKYAVNEVGRQIADLEDVLAVADAHPTKAVDLLQNLNRSKLKMLTPLLKQDFRDFQVKSWAPAYLRPLLKVPFLGPLVVGSVGFPFYVLGRLEALHKALVIGNTEIHADIAPAFDAFMRAEAAGQDGVAAVKALPGLEGRDPQDYLGQAFTRYKEARALTARAEAATDAERESLLARREQLVAEANLFVGLHEQMDILQAPDVFGDPQVASLVDAMDGQMSVTDPLGKHLLLPNGGRWTDFATRMGMVPARAGEPGAIAVRDHEGAVRFYKVEPDPARRVGTIASYFEDGLDTKRAQALIAGVPPRVA